MNNQHIGEHDLCQHSNGFKFKCVPWGAIIVGALVALGLSFLLNLFGMAIGLAAFKSSPDGAATLAIGGYIGMLIGVIAVMYFAGWVAGYLGRGHCFSQYCGALYGFAAWCLALVIMILILAQTAKFIAANFYSFTNHHEVVMRLVKREMPPQVPHDFDHNHKMDRVNNAPGATKFNDEQVAKGMAQTLFMMFFLFFVGAISSAIGGHCGLNPKSSPCSGNKN